ncbi:hypothetical protein [Aeromonas phage MJG]|uniref:Uncharacterized protein n=1 Tax=Aeromonas phage MJG TaxID=2510451 RepID=A0A5J6A097_9CAUD|nr:hypothetical protein [Aeromonas phage MJG]
MNILTEFNLQAVIAGGFARDMFHGKDAKDVDINVGLDNLGDYDAMRSAILYIKAHYKSTKVWEGNPQHDGSEFEGSVPSEEDHLVNTVVSIPELNTDVIFYDCEAGLDIVKQFDCNLNEYVLVGNVPQYIGTSPIDDLRWLRDGISSERVSKMVKKWTELFPPKEFKPF